MSKINSSTFIKFLGEKWGGKVCPMCQIGTWSVQDSVFELREYHGGDMVIGGGGSILPVVPVTCNNCGNTVLINAIKAGAIEQPPTEDAPAEKKGKGLSPEGGGDE